MTTTPQNYSGTQVITLPWPPKGLSPNDRLHWTKLAKAIAQGMKPIKAERLHVSLVFQAKK